MFKRIQQYTQKQILLHKGVLFVLLSRFDLTSSYMYPSNPYIHTNEEHGSHINNKANKKQSNFVVNQ